MRVIKHRNVHIKNSRRLSFLDRLIMKSWRLIFHILIRTNWFVLRAELINFLKHFFWRAIFLQFFIQINSSNSFVSCFRTLSAILQINRWWNIQVHWFLHLKWTFMLCQHSLLSSQFIKSLFLMLRFHQFDVLFLNSLFIWCVTEWILLRFGKCLSSGVLRSVLWSLRTGVKWSLSGIEIEVE